MPHPGDKIYIPLDEKTAVIGLFKVKPTKDMPRPGAAKKARREPNEMQNPEPKYTISGLLRTAEEQVHEAKRAIDRGEGGANGRLSDRMPNSGY